MLVVRGQTSILKCASSGTSALNYLRWSRNNYRNYSAIYENPSTEGGTVSVGLID